MTGLRTLWVVFRKELIDGGRDRRSMMTLLFSAAIAPVLFGILFTVAAERENVENLLVIHAPALATRYGETWQAHAAHSVRYVAKP